MTHVPLAARPLAGLLPGDHVCCSFGSDDEQQAIVARHARVALDRGAQFVYVADRCDEATVRAFLDEDGIDTDGGLASGQIQIRRWLVPDGEIDVEAMIDAFEQRTATALAAGYSGLVSASEMSWSVDRQDESHRILRYELEVNRAFDAADVIGLCLYDRRLLAPSMLAPLEAAHGYRVRTHEHGTVATRRRLTVTEDDDLVLSLRGELDVDAAPYVAARLAARASVGDLVVDMSQLEFIDVSGCRRLVEAAEGLRAGHRMVLVDPGPHLLKILSVCGWREHPQLVLA
ncbi:MAG: MEDS domain-containing protein [Solirubrobacteraceae bacterium]